MKKAIFLLAILFVFSCNKKDPPECWLCMTQSRSTVGTIVIRSSDITTHPCDLTPAELESYIKDRTFLKRAYEPNPPYSDIYVTTISQCTCTKE